MREKNMPFDCFRHRECTVKYGIASCSACSDALARVERKYRQSSSSACVAPILWLGSFGSVSFQVVEQFEIFLSEDIISCFVSTQETDLAEASCKLKRLRTWMCCFHFGSFSASRSFCLDRQ